MHLLGILCILSGDNTVNIFTVAVPMLKMTFCDLIFVVRQSSMVLPLMAERRKKVFSRQLFKGRWKTVDDVCSG
jgi:hypothetical protein